MDDMFELVEAVGKSFMKDIQGSLDGIAELDSMVKRLGNPYQRALWQAEVLEGLFDILNRIRELEGKVAQMPMVWEVTPHAGDDGQSETPSKA